MNYSHKIRNETSTSRSCKDISTIVTGPVPSFVCTRAIKRDCFPFWRRLVRKLANNGACANKGCAGNISHSTRSNFWTVEKVRGGRISVCCGIGSLTDGSPNGKSRVDIMPGEVVGDAWWTIYAAECSNIGRATVLVDA